MSVDQQKQRLDQLYTEYPDHLGLKDTVAVAGFLDAAQVDKETEWLDNHSDEIETENPNTFVATHTIFSHLNNDFS